MRLALWLVIIVLAVGTGAYFGFLPDHARTPSFWLIVGAPTVVLAALGLFRAHKNEELRGWLKPEWGDFTRGFLGAAVLFAGAVVMSKVVFPAGSPRTIWLSTLYLQIGSPEELQPHAAKVALVLIVLAAAEEILWRGLVTTLIAERIGSRHAWIYAAVLYGLAHVPVMFAMKLGDNLNPVVPLAALGCGLVWGAMTRLFRRITPGILAHALFDWCIVMMFPLWSMKSS